MSSGHFCHQSVSSQQSDSTSDLSGPSPLLLLGTLGAEKHQAEVTVPRSVDRKFSLADGLQKFGVFRRPGIQGPVFSSVSSDGLADFLRPLEQRHCSADCAQSLKIFLI